MKSDRALVAHLMRRAGFGVTPAELDTLTSEKSYEQIVDDLVNPERFEELDESYIERYYSGELVAIHVGKWMYRMVNTQRPLEEKMALFLHHIFPVAWGKSEHGPSLYTEIEMFRRVGLTDMQTILLELSQDPAMIFWLDNNENHKGEINENYGRELLELFTMGVGNYTETDVRECSRAFTGWTLKHKLPRFHMGRWDWDYEFRPDDHDYGEKTFLGHTGNFDGEEIIDIILSKAATAAFIARHLYSFFVADEHQVPAWSVTPPNDPEAVQFIADALIESDFHIGTVLKKIFNSDFFKDATFKRVKNPAEVVIGTLRLVEDTDRPSPETMKWASQIGFMGQELLNPPSVEGWHSGIEWINSGTLMKRTNFTAEMISDLSRPGVVKIIDRIKASGTDPEAVVDACLDVMGPLEIPDESRGELLDHARQLGEFDWEDDRPGQGGDAKLTEILQLVVSLREYQFA